MFTVHDMLGLNNSYAKKLLQLYDLPFLKYIFTCVYIFISFMMKKRNKVQRNACGAGYILPLPIEVCINLLTSQSFSVLLFFF